MSIKPLLASLALAATTLSSAHAAGTLVSAPGATFDGAGNYSTTWFTLASSAPSVTLQITADTPELITDFDFFVRLSDLDPGTSIAASFIDIAYSGSNLTLTYTGLSTTASYRFAAQGTPGALVAVTHSLPSVPVPVPEPESIALALAGLGVAAAALRRRQAA